MKDDHGKAERTRFKWIAAIVVLVALIVINWPRANITDPAALSKMPPRDLREVEIEILIRAAFRNAQKVVVHAESPTGGTDIEKEIDDPLILDQLADSFSVGRDWAGVKPFFRPQLAYSIVTFEGPFQPNFTFTDDTQILVLGGIQHVHGGTETEICTTFARQLADLVGIGEGPR